MPDALRALTDDELLSVFNDDRADLSLLTGDEQQRLLALTDADAPTFRAENEKDAEGNAIVAGVDARDWSEQAGLHKPTSSRTLGFLRGSGTAVVDMAEGAASGLAKTVYGGGDLIRRGLGLERIIQTPEAQEAMRAPDTFAGHAGQILEQGAEFAVPLSAVSKGVKGARLITRMGVEGAAGAGVGALQSGGDTSTTVTAGVLGAALPIAGAGVRVAKRAAAGASEGGLGGAVASFVRKAGPEEPGAMLVQALKPRNTKPQFGSALDRAMPEIKAAEATIGRPVASLEDLLEATTAAKKSVWAQVESMAGGKRAAGFEVDLSLVADDMTKSLPRKVRLEDPRKAAALLERADVYRKRFSLDDAEQLLLETNAELESFYGKHPFAQRAALRSDPEAAILEAQATGLRKAIYRVLDEGTGAARELKRRYGALMEVEQEASRRFNVAKRQQPDSLSEQLGRAQAAGQYAKGAYKIVRGSPFSGMADIVGAKAQRDTATFLKEQQTADALIRRAFAAFKGTPSPVVMPAPRRVAGLLGRGPIVPAAPKDASFVRGVPAQPLLSGRPRQLGSGARRMPAAPDPSAVRSVDAAPIDYALDPMETVRAGGFRVAQFSSDPAAAKAVVAAPEVRSMLQRMAADLDTFAPQRGGLVDMPTLNAGDPHINRPNAGGHYVEATPGSPVADDIRVISEQNVANREIQRAIQDLLEGKMPSNRLHTAALDAAMGYLEKRPGYRGPSVPDWVVNGDDGFDDFSRSVDELAGVEE